MYIYYFMDKCKVEDFQILLNNNITIKKQESELNVAYDIIHTSKLRHINCKLSEDKQMAYLTFTTEQDSKQYFSVDVSTPEEINNLKQFITRLEFIIYNNPVKLFTK